MLLNEIFNSKYPTTWTKTGTGHIGKFSIGEDDFEVILDEYDLKLDNKIFSLIDFGFKRNDSWLIQKDGSAFKSLGGIFNAAVPKINSLRPDYILFGVQNKNGEVESRVSAYQTFSRLLVKGSSYSYESGWFQTANGTYKFVGKSKPSEQALLDIQSTAASIQLKE